MSGDVRDFKNVETRALIKDFFLPARQGAEGNSHHSERNIRGICTIVCHHQKLGGPVQTWWFFHLWCASSSTTQNSDHSRDYWSNSRVNLGRPRDFRKINSWATGHLTWEGWVRHSWRFGHAEALREVGPEMPERGSKTSTVPVVWAKFEFFWRDPNDFLSRLVTMDYTWLYHYDSETKQQSLEWRHSGSPRPKKSECKNPLEKFSPGFVEIKTAPPHWLSSKGPNYQRGVLLISAAAIEGYFEGKTPRECHQGRLVLTRQCPGSPGTCNPKWNWPTWASSVLITNPILQIWPRRTTTCSLDWKNLKCFYFSSNAEVISTAQTWLDGQRSEILFEWLAEVRAMG